LKVGHGAAYAPSVRRQHIIEKNMYLIFESLKIAFHDTLLIIALIIPFILIGLWRFPSANRKLIILVAVLIFINNAFLTAPKIFPYPMLHWNWQGKIFGILWATIFLLVYRSLSFSEFGLTIKINTGSFWPIVVMSLIVLLPNIIGFVSGSRSQSNTETLLFQMTMPGLSEELIFRGVYQSLLNRSFGKPRVVWGAQVGFGLILTAILFGLVHFISIDDLGRVHYSVVGLLSSFGVGMGLGWIRERSGSILPGIVLHNLINTLPII
jgi:uncharacterized protein